ncbi:MAG: signal peptide peptidase SppA [Alphaproteobacteria bacterium]
MRAIGRWFARLVTGLAFACLLLVVTLVGLGWWGASRLDEREVAVPENVVLVADWRGGVAEKSRGPTPFAALGLDGEPPLPDVLRALERAADDPRVRGLVVRTDGAGFGLAQAWELRRAVQRLNEAGKFTAIYADTLGELQGGMVGTYLASAFEHVQLQPLGSVGFTGLRREQPYLERLLDELEIEFQVVKREAFKSALESLTRAGPSPESEAMTEALLDGLFAEFVDGVAAGRGLDPKAVRAAIDAAPLLAEDARERGLIDAVAHLPELETTAAEATGTDERLPLAGYLRSDAFAAAEEAPVVGFVHAVGQIRRGDSDDPFGELEIAGDTVAGAIDAAREAEVDALLLRVSSPGGSAVASETVGAAVRRAKDAGIPVIVSMGDVAASGGYWIAMDADRILAAPTTLTGSIGVILGKPAFGAFLDDLGIDVDGSGRGANAGLGSLVETWDERELAKVNSLVDDLYDAFLEGVARGRGMEAAAVRGVAGGRVWLGQQAVANGLVDEIGGFNDAVMAVRTALDVAPDDALTVQAFPRPRGPLPAALEALERFTRITGELDARWHQLTARPELRFQAPALPGDH